MVLIKFDASYMEIETLQQILKETNQKVGTQSELNTDGTYTIFFVSGFEIGFDTELTQYGVESPTAKISSFHLANEEKFKL